jgi:uncharacterized Zn finger protein
MPDLNEWITRSALEEYADPTVYQRGEVYFRQGAVTRLRDAGAKATARVNGTEAYDVELWTDGEEFGYACTCLHAAEGHFCKHCVAAGLAFLADREQGYQPSLGESEALGIIRRYLLLQPPETLVDWLLDAAEQDTGLQRKLLLRAQRAGGAIDLAKAFRREIDNATRTQGYIEYDEVAELAEELERLVDSLAELQTPETGALLIELAEYAIEKIEPAMNDSADEEGEIASVIERFGELHLKACGMAPPDPVLLAERLFRYEVEEGSDFFYNSPSAYAEVLGPSGLRRFQELAEAAWRELPVLTEKDAGMSGFAGDRWRLAQAMESLARQSGDVDTLAAVKARDLSRPERYLEIAQAYQDAQQGEKALDWAERGLQAFPSQPGNRLRDFLAAAYLERGRQQEALELVWIQFAERPVLEHYQKLHGLTAPLGLWPAQRERALAELDAAAARAMPAKSGHLPNAARPDHSERIKIALWENDVEAAWQALQSGACLTGLQLRIAERLAPTRPADAAAIYQAAIANLIGQTKNSAYEEALGLLKKTRTLMPQEMFSAYLGQLRLSHKQKRNFIALLANL